MRCAALLAATALTATLVTTVVTGRADDPDPPAAAVDPHTITPVQALALSDEFGVSFVHPSRTGGTYWTASWDSERRFSGVDPQDLWFDADHGSGRYRAGGGLLRVTGANPRMYVHDPAQLRQWSDVEVTVYARRVDDDAIPYAGITMVARTNHLVTEDGSSDLCDTRGYGARLRFDGHADLEKETAHPRNEAIRNVEVFPGGMPRGRWIGVKFVVYDDADGVHLELWLDETEGRDGGDWRLITQAVDDGRLFGSVACAPGIDPLAPLTGEPTRWGSESGRPNLSVFFRSDGIATDGLIYRWASVREISP